MKKLLLLSLSASTTKLDSPAAVESDEFYIKAGLKGRSHHYEIRKLGRNLRKRGLKPWRGRRGTFDKDLPMITYIHNKGNGMIYFDVPVR